MTKESCMSWPKNILTKSGYCFSTYQKQDTVTFHRTAATSHSRRGEICAEMVRHPLDTSGDLNTLRCSPALGTCISALETAIGTLCTLFWWSTLPFEITGIAFESTSSPSFNLNFKICTHFNRTTQAGMSESTTGINEKKCETSLICPGMSNVLRQRITSTSCAAISTKECEAAALLETSWLVVRSGQDQSLLTHHSRLVEGSLKLFLS